VNLTLKKAGWTLLTKNINAWTNMSADGVQLPTQNIMHALHFDLTWWRFKLLLQRLKGEASIERHALYLNVS
jgi:hypothetical protein